jgi:hypothetical protein
MQALLPYLDDFWREAVEERGINSLETVTYPPNGPLTSRPQWRGSSAGLRSLACGDCDLQLPLRREPTVQRGHGGCFYARAQ